MIGCSISGYLVGWFMMPLWVFRDSTNPALDLTLVVTGILGAILCNVGYVMTRQAERQKKSSKRTRYTQRTERLSRRERRYQEARARAEQTIRLATWADTATVSPPPHPLRPEAVDPTQDKVRGPD